MSELSGPVPLVTGATPGIGREADGAASVVWATTLPDDGPTGGIFRDGRPLPW